MTIQEVAGFVIREASQTLQNYTIGTTEIEGCTRVAVGVGMTVYGILWRMVDSDDLGTGAPIANEAIMGSLEVVASGLIRLAVPIVTLTASCVVARRWRWI